MNNISLRSLFQLLSWRHLRRQWLRTLFSLIGVVMGVSTFIFAPTIATAIQSSTSLTVNDLSGTAQIEIRSAAVGFDAGLLDTVRQTSGVSLAAPVSQSGGLLMGQDELLIFFGIDSQIDGEIRSYHLVQGEFLSASGGVLLTEVYAQEKGIVVGDSVTLVSAGGFRVLTVVGTLVGDGGIARMNGGDVVVLGLDDAYALRGANELDSISVLAADGQDINALTDSLRAVLPANVVIDSPASRMQGANDFQLVVNVLMSTISLMILGLGSMLIYNTIAVSVAQRRAEIGLLRALGVLRGDVRWMFVVEAGILGLMGSLLGIVFGYALVAVGSQLPVMPQFSSVQTLTSKAEISVPLWLPPIALIFGVLIPMLAGYFPSRAASLIDPVEAMAQVRAERGSMSFSRWRWIAAGVILLTVLIARYTLHGGLQFSVMLANVGLIASLIPAILILPPLMIALGRVLPNILHRLFGIPGMIAASNLTRRPKRLLVSAMLLMLGLGGSVLISQSNFGYQDFINEWVTGENVGDLTVTGAGASPFAPMYGVPDDVVQEIAARDDVSGVIVESLTTIEQGGITYGIRGVDIGAFRALGGRYAWNKGDEPSAYERLLDLEHPAVLVMTSFSALANGLEPGAFLTLETPSGSQTFEVVGTLLGSIEADRIFLTMERTLYSRLWGDTEIDRLQVQLRSNADVQTARRELLQAYALRGIVTYDISEVRAAFMKQIASISTISQMLSVLPVIIIVVGLGSTLFVAVIDRRREIGMLRAVGMLRRQITQAIVLEAVVLIVLCGVIGIPTGILAMEMQQMAMQNIMGIRFSFSLHDVTMGVLVIAVTALIAAYFPARVAGRTDVLEAMHYE